MVPNEMDEICITCGRVELVYSIPPKSSDTTTKAKMDAGNLQCKECTQRIKQERKQEREKKRLAKIEKQKNIKELEESKKQIFERLWNDVDRNGTPRHTKDDTGMKIVNLPEHIRLMWMYIKNEIRESKLGFQATDEMKVIKRGPLQNIIQHSRQERQRIQSDLARELTSKEQVDKDIADIDSWETMQIKELITYVNTLHIKANREWENKPEDEWERMVKKPGYRDPEGNKAPRYHLLSDKPTYHERRALRQRQINNINRIDKVEDQISDKNEKRLMDDGMTSTS